ncbi:oleate hydratase [Anaerospora hongkongensis]|uniref:Oleate hydratase n=1 Tax=Anaerospora hongkongensis TaxID=244830 RepID=A0A4R1Q4I1_9FIRM|nr:oleate hydratase [Anaerospora hongkongensis]TCL35685.1 oleate hydratase [Anaerospora hongkongensis]
MKHACQAVDRQQVKAYFSGAGVGSLAGAVYLIRDGHIPGKNITIFEEMNITGGSCDGTGSPEKGYMIRGGRMLNDEAYECTWELLKFIPSITNPQLSVRDEIIAFDNAVRTHAKARLVDGEGKIIDVASMGFTNKDRIDLLKLTVTPEDALGTITIEQFFSSSFFKTNFWYMWATTFAFQPWHSAVEFKRYLLRFMHEFPRIHTLEGVTRTPYNQYDSIILPLIKWLQAQGVNFSMNCRVTDLDFKPSDGDKTVEYLHYISDGKPIKLQLKDTDLVFVTNGSMTEGYSIGSMTSAPRLGAKGAAFKLWETLAAKQPDMGNPAPFIEQIEKSAWESFTVTCTDPVFFDLMENFSGNTPGTGALVTLRDSNWFMSIVLAYQPHFINQPDTIKVFWGYGLSPENQGNFVHKKMSECTGEEILTELCSHLRFTDKLPSIVKTSNCLPCMMPFITSQFMPRTKSDRPQVVPPGSTNLAFLGQFTEIPDDVVFTVEYSVRSAQIAVYSLLNLNKEIPPIHQYQFDTRILFDSFITSFR